jgi:hypothetical protein
MRFCLYFLKENMCLECENGLFVSACQPVRPYISTTGAEQSDDFRKNLCEQQSITGDPHAVHWLFTISITNMHPELSYERRAAYVVPTVMSWNVF